jgi:hypothetical protein
MVVKSTHLRVLELKRGGLSEAMLRKRPGRRLVTVLMDRRSARQTVVLTRQSGERSLVVLRNRRSVQLMAVLSCCRVRRLAGKLTSRDPRNVGPPRIERLVAKRGGHQDGELGGQSRLMVRSKLRLGGRWLATGRVVRLEVLEC